MLDRGLGVYGAGAVIAALAPGLAALILGYSAFEGVGSALMIPPIYILATIAFSDVRSRARAFGAIKTGVIFTAATVGVLLSSVVQPRLAKKYQQRTLIRVGFIVALAGATLLAALVKSSNHIWAFLPGLLSSVSASAEC